MMDILYPVKEHENNYELRYSLRTLVNVPHDKVFMAGYKPTWVTDDVIHIAIDQDNNENKYIKSLRNLIAACEDPRLSEEFILMNDDMFILMPTKYIPTLQMGLLVKMADRYYRRYQNSPYTQGLLRVLKYLQSQGIEDPLSYELHVPMVFNKKKLLETLRICEELEGFGKRTLYGNLNAIGGDYFEDVKYTNQLRPIYNDMPFVSTDEGSFAYHPIGRFIREKFSEPGKYEKEMPWLIYPK